MSLLAYRPSAYPSKFSDASELLYVHKLFQQHFEILEADSPELLEQVLTLRYQIYCLENPFENASNFPNKMERDCYDEYSIHALIRHRDTGEVVATVRLVRPNSSGHGNGFPMESCCGTLLTNISKEAKISSHYSPAEISRFAVSKDVRRRIIKTASTTETEHSGKAKPDNAYWDRLLYSHLTLELFAAAMHLSDKYKITHWYSLASPALFRTLRRFGIRLTSIGPAIEYRGMRLPCIDNLETLLRRVYQAKADAWSVLTNHGAIWPDSKRNYIEASTKTKRTLAMAPYRTTALQPQIASA
jgi:N-acyl amino acid synthase of PEP-CTERM/exosortase system